MEEYTIKEFNGILYPSNKEESDYTYINFNLPEGYNNIELEYNFNKEDGCILDIGIFDARNLFRGWSGSSKTKIHIDDTSATPGYIAGEMYPGTWTVVLGLAKITDCGCKYRIVIRMSKHRSRTSSGETCVCREEARRTANGRWIKGDLHVHTIHSDGKDGVCSLILKAIKLGLDYIAITDHNTISQITEIETAKCPEILVIPGIEISTYYGHINTWGRRWFDFRRKDISDFKSLIDEIHREGLLASLNHPFNFDVNCIGCDFKYKELIGFDSIEVWNGPTPVTWNAYALNWWHNLLAKGMTIPIIGGSDYHGGSDVELANPTTWIYVNELTMESMLEGIRRGRAFISRGPEGPKVDMGVYQGDKRYYIGDRIENARKQLKISIDVEVTRDIIDKYVNEAVLRIITSREVIKVYNIRGKLSRFVDTINVDDGTKFIRVEVGRYKDPYSLEPNTIIELLALTNPIYIT
ncbi:MAG: CehA/McbA family metallohydrolase [Ignisphaera sp.]